VAGVAEVSVYVSEIFRKQGIGSALLTRMIAESEQEAFWTLQAQVIADNHASRSLHKKKRFSRGRTTRAIWPRQQYVARCDIAGTPQP
jgi:L-amino acid N-acyltransferase YncA